MSRISDNARNVVECPFCREMVAKGASRCPHCHENLKIPKKKKKAPPWRSSFMLGFYTATIIWLVLIIYYIWNY